MDRPPQEPRHVRSSGSHPAGLVANLLAAERAPATLALRAQPGGVDMLAPDPVQDQVEGEDEILGGGGPEAMSKGQRPTDRHSGAAQAHRESEAVAAPRERDSLEGKSGERSLGSECAAALALAASLNRVGPSGKRLFAGVEEAWRDHGIRVEHHHCVPRERPRVLEACLAGGSTTGFLLRRALEHGGAEPAGDRRRRVGAAVGDDQHQVARTGIGTDSLEAAADHLLLVVGGDEHEEPDPVAASGAPLAIEQRAGGQQTEMRGGGKARQPEHDREQDDDGHRSSTPRGAPHLRVAYAEDGALVSR